MANTDKFKNKYRIPSARLASWDYGTNAAYFVTICTADKVCYFGTIVETHDHASLPPQTQYTPLGMAAVECWNEIPAHFPFVELGEFIVMPNHVHGVIIINKPAGTVETRFVETRFVETRFVETRL